MKKSFIKSLLIIMILLVILSSCASKNTAAENRLDGSAEIFDQKIESESAGVGSVSDSSSTLFSTGRKIIETVRLSVQTKDFDQLIDALNQQVTTLGGYIESSSITGREIDSTRNRNADFTIRIPCQSTNLFTDFVSESSVIINKSVSTEDVTLNYVDIESRVSALESEKAALEKLLNSASTVSDVVDIRDKLTDVIYEIESNKSKLRTYDNLVDYSTVSIHISEVERTAIVEKQTVFQKIGNNLKTNFENVWAGVVNIFIFIVSAIPYLIPIGIISTIIIIPIKIKSKNKKNKASE